VRLTVRRLEAATPLSMAEIQADKDQLRAEFAMSTRRLEMSVDTLKNKSTGQLAELGKKNDVINRLKIELGEKAATIFALEARDKGIKDQLRATEDELEVKTNNLRETERNLADKEAELAKASASLTEQTATSDSQRVEIVALKTQVDNFKDQVATLEFLEPGQFGGHLVSARHQAAGDERAVRSTDRLAGEASALILHHHRDARQDPRLGVDNTAPQVCCSLLCRERNCSQREDDEGPQNSPQHVLPSQTA